jgi:hypothetical protein
MSIAAASVAPNFLARRSITAQELRRLQEPAVIHEGKFFDSDGAPFHVYTVAGWLNGENVFTPHQGGATVGGEAIVIPIEDRDTADQIAGMGLQDTIEALNGEEQATLAALAAKARLEAVNPIRRMELATAPDSEKNPEFVADSEAIRSLRGDGIVLAAGGVEDAPT